MENTLWQVLSAVRDFPCGLPGRLPPSRPAPPSTPSAACKFPHRLFSRWEWGGVQLGVQGSPTLLSSMTVLRDSIHMGSMSPSRTIHLGPSCVMLARSRMMVENRPVGRQASDMHGHVCRAKWHDGCSGAFTRLRPGGSDLGLARSHFLRGGWSPFKGTTVAFFFLVVLPTPLPLPSSEPPIPFHRRPLF